MNIIDLIPPFILKVLKNIPSSKTFATYDDALKKTGNGYGNKILIEAIIDKNINYGSSKHIELNKENLELVSAISLALEDNSISVVDFGGGCGHHYYTAKKIIKNGNRLDWYVIETPELIEAVKNNSLNDSIKFFSKINIQKKINLVYANGSIQYTKSPLATLNSLITLKPKYILISRTPLTYSQEPIITIQKSRLSANGPGKLTKIIKDTYIYYPITYSSKKLFEDMLTLEYEIIGISNKTNYTFKVNKHYIETMSYLCKRKSNL